MYQYCPRPLQIELHHAVADKRFGVFCIHRRFGKTIWAINQLIFETLDCKKPNARGAYIAPLYRQVKQIAWEYLKAYTRAIPGTTYNEAELRADFVNGARISLFGGSNANALRGIYLDAAVIDETAQIPKSLWHDVLRPALADRQGKAWFIGTPLGMHNLFYELWETAGAHPDDWARRTITAHESQVIAAEELRAIQRQMPAESFKQEFLCSWSAAIRGAFFSREMEAAENEGRITDVPYDPEYPVHTSWDLGVSDSTVVTYWQMVGRRPAIIRCEAFQGMQLSEIVKQVASHGYTFGTHIGPHDIEVRELGGGSRRQQALALGVRFKVAPKVDVYTGIDKVRALLRTAYIDRTHTGDLIEALKTYRADYNEERQVFSTKPLHDWASDYADSVRYFAVTPQKDATLTPWREPPPLDYSALDAAII